MKRKHYFHLSKKTILKCYKIQVVQNPRENGGHTHTLGELNSRKQQAIRGKKRAEWWVTRKSIKYRISNNCLVAKCGVRLRDGLVNKMFAIQENVEISAYLQNLHFEISLYVSMLLKSKCWGDEIGRLWGLLVSQPRLHGKFQVSERLVS